MLNELTKLDAKIKQSYAKYEKQIQELKDENQELKDRINTERLAQEKKSAMARRLENAEEDSYAALEEARNEVNTLKNRIYALEQAGNAALEIKEGGLVSAPPLEKEKYLHEFSNIITSALEEAHKHIGKPSRRKDVLAALIKANPADRSYEEDWTRQLRNILKDYRGLTPEIRNTLIRLGFSIQEASKGGHYKITWQEDERYTFVSGDTPSDIHAGKNMFRFIISRLFG